MKHFALAVILLVTISISWYFSQVNSSASLHPSRRSVRSASDYYETRDIPRIRDRGRSYDNPEPSSQQRSYLEQRSRNSSTVTEWTQKRKTGLNGGRKDTSHPHSRASSASSQQVANGFGPIRVTDNEIPGGSVNVIHRRYNSSSTSETILPGGPKIVPHNQSPPTLWFNRTWHWSTNRTREYDPDLDGTTLPSVEDIEIMPPPIREPYDITFPWETASCDERSCHPGTGNLLIGREKNLTATSTCGLQGPEDYCVLSGPHQQRKKCFKCDSSQEFRDERFKYHAIENIVPTFGTRRKGFWWQAENGVENVSIQLDLETEFHFTHLMIIFQTFRPAAMIIERSKDFGRTWEVYQYFAYNCKEVFGIENKERRNLADVVCTEKYSSDDHASFGEVIFRVLPPSIRIDNPYAPEVQNLLKLTNLRLNFTKLHTLGDNLLDARPEIKEKYYYAIQKMIVRGKCSCYGHASRCVPGPDEEVVADKVYGNCLCQHHTSGSNCQNCEELYNDLEWKPAVGEETNICKKCNCNNHAKSCHFDEKIFELSGRISGGVCDDCEDNTDGKNCELCKHNFYKNKDVPDDHPNTCLPCDCDPDGSLNDGVCDPLDDEMAGTSAGKCHCKQNVDGRRCDRCKKGYWNFSASNYLGCEPCSCNQLGTVGNQGCNFTTGECTCKRNVVGRDCNQCAPEFWGLGSEEDGCKACDCDPGGSYDNKCNDISGQCKCRPHVTGRRCDTPESLYFTPLIDHLTFEGEKGRGSENTQNIDREPYPNVSPTWTGSGFVRLLDNSRVEFDITDVPLTSFYDVYVRYEPQSVGATPDTALVNLDRIAGAPRNICSNVITDSASVTFPANERVTKTADGNALCLERGVPYRLSLDMNTPYDSTRDHPSILIDSIVLVPKVDSLPLYTGNTANERKLNDLKSYRCLSYALTPDRREIPEVCKEQLNSLGLFTFDGARECACDPTGSSSAICNQLGGQCECKANVIGRRCNKCAPGFFGFGPDGCTACDCNNVGSVDNFCDERTGQCKCRSNTYGRKCNQCQPGFWNYPNCQRCDCNGHSDTCDSATGACTNCRDNTAGPTCGECERGFYGNPMQGTDIKCRPCPCPGTPGTGVSRADTCKLDPRTLEPICNCLPGYAGQRCDRCDHNYFGSPTLPTGCQMCNCNNNTDLSVPGNCDPRTGECLQCLQHTTGKNCEICQPGWFGDATKQSCAQCVCNDIGTNRTSQGEIVCDQSTGQCPCLPNVVGKECNECAPAHYDLASGTGCKACDCDTSGSYSLKCNLFDGQCHCKPGHGDRRCNQCQENYWGDPRVECFPCDCSSTGSSSKQCNRETGACVCKEGIAGDKCDKCARGFIGNAPNCERCSECFENWDVTIQELKRRTDRLVEDARLIKQKGTTGAYKSEFNEIENHLNEIEKIISGANVTQTDVASMDRLINALRDDLNKIQDALKALSNRMGETAGRTTDSILQLSHLKNSAATLSVQTANIKENMTALQEANVEGAFNLTRESHQRSSYAVRKVQATMAIVSSSTTKRTETEDMLNKYSANYNASYFTNEESLKNLGRKIKALEGNVPSINNLVCDGRASIDECDNLCGGANCGKCGGISCKGATSLASESFDLANKSKDTLNEKHEKSRKELDGILSAKSKSDEALKQAILAYEKSLFARNTSYDTTNALQQLLDDIDRFFIAEATRPKEIRVIAEECIALKMSLTPNQILDLAKQINETMSGITNIESILVSTAGDLQVANDLKRRADLAKARADEILNASRQVLDALERAKEAQDKASEAIRKANGDINNANIDLIQIKTESEVALNLSANGQTDIATLQGRLDELKKKSSKNGWDVKRVATESEEAGKLADDAAKKANDLQSKYSQAKSALEQKTRDSGANKQRAEKLRDRAKALAETTTSKYRELQGLGDEFDDNERRLKEYLKSVDDLNGKMREHLQTIEKRAEFHRSCVP